MTVVRAVLAVLAVAVALPGAAAALHLGVLAVASLPYREPRPAGPVPRVRFLVLIPAHNEERVIARTLRSVDAARRTRDRVVVVADRCTDRTEEIARSHGAEVLVRGPGEEPGRAAARQAGLRFAMTQDWDAIVMIDADSVCNRGYFDACERAFALGAEALQTRSEAALGSGLVAQASLASFALQGVLIPRGRDRLGLLVRLRGTGMVLSRRVIETYEFRAAAGEDRWYGLDLCMDGVLPRHVESARLRSENVSSWRAASTQRLRYEAGRMSAAREFVLPLLRRRHRAAFEAAVELATPPYAIAMLSLALGGALAAASGVLPLLVALAALLVLLGAVLVVGLLQARATARTWLALLSAPWYMLWKVGVQVRALTSVRRGETRYAPTARE